MKKIFGLLFLGFIAFGLTACGQLLGPGGDDTSSGGNGGEHTNKIAEVKANFGSNFEIECHKSTGYNEIIKRQGDSCYYAVTSADATQEYLYHQGKQYLRLESQSQFIFISDVDDYNVDNIVWNETLLSVELLSYSDFDFSVDQGWTSSSSTVCDRSATKYTNNNVGSIYIDTATGGTFKFDGVGNWEVGSFEVTSFSKGTADLSSYISNIAE